MGRSERKRGIMPSTENAIRLPERKPGVYDRRGRRIADELESQVEEKTIFGQLPRSVNTNLAAYDESVTLPAMYGQLPADYKDTEQKAGRTAEKFRAGAGFGSQGVTTSPNSGNVPMSWAQYETFLASKGIELARNKTRTTGFEANDLPAGSEPITASKLAEGTGAYTDMLYGGKLRQGDMTTPELRGLGTGAAENYRIGTYGVDSQAGTSPVPDSSDQSRQLEVDQGQNPAAPSEARLSGLSARSRAILDAPMGEGPMGLLRRANAAQNIVRNNGKIAIKDADGNFNEITQEGYDEIRNNRRDQTEFSQDFLKQYITTPAKPADAQSSDAVQPKPASVDPAGEANPYQTNLYSNQLQGDIGSMFVDKDREPLMRFPGIK